MKRLSHFLNVGNKTTFANYIYELKGAVYYKEIQKSPDEYQIR